MALEACEGAPRLDGERARLLALRHRNDEAITLAERVLSATPTDGWAAMALLEAADSEAQIARAVLWLPKLDPHFVQDEDYVRLSTFLLLGHRRSGEALRRFREFGSRWPAEMQNALRPLLETAAHVEEGRFNNAIESAGEGLAVFRPMDDSVEYLRGLLYFYLGKSLLRVSRGSEALAALREAEARFVDDADSSWSKELASLLEEANHSAGAEAADAQRASSTAPTTAYEVLRTLGSALEESGQHRELARRILDDCAQFDTPPLVAVMGEYSVGKSTFINALVRRGDLLPTGEGVTTGTITVLRHGETERMRAVFNDGRVVERPSLQSVATFVRESQSGERAGLHHVDVFLQADVLKRICIVDSPGLNAPFPEHAATTEAFLAQADAILFLFNVERAATATERDFLDKLRVHRRKTVAVVNQIDLVSTSDAAEVIEGVGEDFPDTFAGVLGVSGKRAVDGLRSGDVAKIDRAGLPALENWLEVQLLSQARTIKEDAARERARGAILEVAAARKAFDKTIEDMLKRLRDGKQAAQSWMDEALALSVHSASVVLQTNTQLHRLALAQSISQNWRRGEGVSVVAVDGFVRKFASDASASLNQFGEECLARYDSESATWVDTFERLGIPVEWTGFWRSLAEGRVELRSWRKDLLDYLEQAESFIEGFAEGRGVHTALPHVAPDQSPTTEALDQALRRTLAFAHERATHRADRWTRELRDNLEGIFARLDREVRSAASSEREKGFRSVERLGALLS
ncbi:MAG: dynamin family protein [Deltaproteobacteria bacterium]